MKECVSTILTTSSLWLQTDEQVMVREGMSFVEYQSNMVSLAKKIAMTTQEMVGKAGVNPSDLGRLANQLTRDYDVLASNSANAAATSNSQDVSGTLRLQYLVCLVFRFKEAGCSTKLTQIQLKFLKMIC